MSSIAIHILSFICYFHVYSIIISNLSSMLVVFYVIRLTCYLIWFVILTYNHAVLVLILFFSLEIFLYLLFPCHLLSKLLLAWMFLLRFRSRNNYERFFSFRVFFSLAMSPAVPCDACFAVPSICVSSALSCLWWASPGRHPPGSLAVTHRLPDSLPVPLGSSLFSLQKWGALVCSLRADWGAGDEGAYRGGLLFT